MLAGYYAEPGGELRQVDLSSTFEAVGKLSAGKMTEKELELLEEVSCPGCGSCSGMFTANTMNCLTEAMGMGLTGQRYYSGC